MSDYFQGFSLVRGERIAVGIAYSQGMRDYMQDCLSFVFQFDMDPLVDFFGVFDGHDVFGEKVAQHLAENLGTFVLQRLLEHNYKDKVSVIQKCYLEMDKRMSALEMLVDSNGEIKGGSTAVCLWIRENTIISANTGDSRAIMSINRKAVEITRDHKPYKKIETIRIKKAGGFVTGGRVNGILAVSRTFGDYMFKRRKDLPPDKQMVTALPDVRIFEMDENLEFIILASDGVWDCLSNQEAVDFVWAKIKQNHALEDIANAMMKRCITPRKGPCGKDNVTVLICVPLRQTVTSK